MRQLQCLLLASLLQAPLYSSFLFLRRPWTIPNLKYSKSSNISPFSSSYLNRFSSVSRAVLINDIPELVIDGDKNVISSNITNKKPVNQRKSLASSRAKFIPSTQPDFTIIGMKGVQLHYGDAAILKDATFTAGTGERVGLVGANGCGKTSHLKILAGEIDVSIGDIQISPPNAKIAYLKQDFIDSLSPSKTLREELLSVFVEHLEIAKQLNSSQILLESSVGDLSNMESILESMQELQERLDNLGLKNIDVLVDRIISQMGFNTNDADRPVNYFSGGWKMRIGLAKLLLQEPNILLLDEPTNHLDIDSIIWLEQFLKKQELPMIIVSHDREFLNQVCTKIVDIEDGVDISYRGNYSNFIREKDERLRVWRMHFDKQTKFVSEEEKFINSAKDSPNPNVVQQARNKQIKLDKLKSSVDWVLPPPKISKFKFLFPNPPRCTAPTIFTVTGLTHGYKTISSHDSKQLSGIEDYCSIFNSVSFKINKGDRIGIVGPNGIGKSTLLRLLQGTEPPSHSGTVEVGGINVVVNYFQQGVADFLNRDSSVFECLLDAMTDTTHQALVEARNLLAQFRFKGSDVDKRVGDLSGGEKARVVLCRMMMQPANVLLLDEPTNHLDILSKEVLEEALLRFGGTVVLVSHDRYFMSRIAHSIFSIENSTIIQHACDYQTFLLKGKSRETEGDVNICEGQKLIESRSIPGDKYQVSAAPLPRPVDTSKDVESRRRSFGGSGPCGRTSKGVKNANRFNR